MASRSNLFIGMRGCVLAIDRATGQQVWSTPLKGGDFVNVVVDQGELYGATKGELYRLDPANGQVLWTNELKGMGRGLISFACAVDGNTSAMEQKRLQDEAAAAAGGAAAATT